MPKLTYQYRIYPFGDQAEVLERWIDLCRKLYNVALQQRRLARAMGQKIGYPEQQDQLTAVREAFPKFEEVPVHVLQNALLRLDRAYENFFRRCGERKAGKKVKAGFPRFKARFRYHSITCPDKYDYVRDGDLNFPKIGRIRMEMHRPLPEGAVVKACTIKKLADCWYAFLVLDVPGVVKPVHSSGEIGIDVGLEKFAALSDGELVEAPKFLRKAERGLKKAQRVLSRKKKGSNRRAKQRRKVARRHLNVVRRREDFQWKLATELARKYSLLAVEELNVRGMVRNRHLSKSISDASWSAFIRKLGHAAVKAGSRLVKVDARNTSKTCSSCGWLKESMTLEERTFRCEKCGLVLDRDVNAARNILKLGRATPEVTRGETKASAFRYRRKASQVVEPRTVPGEADVA